MIGWTIFKRWTSEQISLRTRALLWIATLVTLPSLSPATLAPCLSSMVHSRRTRRPACLLYRRLATLVALWRPSLMLAPELQVRESDTHPQHFSILDIFKYWSFHASPSLAWCIEFCEKGDVTDSEESLLLFTAPWQPGHRLDFEAEVITRLKCSSKKLLTFCWEALSSSTSYLFDLKRLSCVRQSNWNRKDLNNAA